MFESVAYLSFGEIELAGELSAFPAHHILTPLKLHLQPVELLCSEGGAGPLGSVQIQSLWQDDLSDRAFGIWKMGTFE